MVRYYTPDLANKSLPLVARIAADIQRVAQAIKAAFQQLQAHDGDGQVLTHRIEAMRDEFEGLNGELAQLDVELKDPWTGLLDFRALRAGKEVYLCWRLGEDVVGHWHPMDSGFAGRAPMSDF